MSKNKSKDTVNILGVGVAGTPVNELLNEIEDDIKKKRKFLITTPNPEQVFLAQQDGSFKDILNSADYSLPDGIGLVAANKFLNLPTPKNELKRYIVSVVQGLGVCLSLITDRKWLEAELKVIKGRKMFDELILLSDRKKWKVYLLGGWDKAAERTRLVIEKRFKNIKVSAGTGPVLNDDGKPINRTEKKTEESIVREINRFRPHFLFIGFGAPKQEKWVNRWLAELKIDGAMVVGGTFNYVSGKTKLPPAWVEKLNMEWSWRFLAGSQTSERIVNALVRFPVAVFRSKMKK